MRGRRSDDSRPIRRDRITTHGVPGNHGVISDRTTIAYTRHDQGAASLTLARDKDQTRRIVAVSPDDGSAIDLRNPALAALLSWAVPGLGQLYQGRLFKGRLFMGAILGTFLAGLWLGGGKVVYASWKPGETRWPFVCQAGAGLVAL